MNIAEKLTTIAENVQKVYDAGKAAGAGVPINPLEYATELTETFYGATLPVGYALNLDLSNITTFSSAFQSAKGIEKVVIKGNNNGNVVSFYSMFRACGSIKTLDLTKFNAKISNLQYGFYFATSLYEILGELDFLECTNTTYAFQNCTELKELRIKKETLKISTSFAQSSKFSTETIQSIIDGLADLTGGTAQTLTLHATVGDKLTDEQKATITAKNWELVY